MGVVAAWLLFALVPVLLILGSALLVRRSPRWHRRAATTYLCLGVLAAGIAIGLFVFSPGGIPPKTGIQGPWGSAGTAAAEPDLLSGMVIPAAETVGTMEIEVLRTGDSDIDARVGLHIGVTAGDGQREAQDFEVDLTLQAAGIEPLFNLDNMRYSASGINFPVDAAAAGLHATVTGEQLAAVNGARYPIGISDLDATVEMPVVYTDSWRSEIWIYPSSGHILESHLQVTRTMQVTTAAGLTLSAGTVFDLTMDLACDSTQTTAVDLEADEAARPHRELIGFVIPGALGVDAVAALVVAAWLLRRSTSNGDPATLSPTAT